MRKLFFLPEVHLHHKGPVIGRGFVCPTDKKNHAPHIIPGIWDVRKCLRCGDLFANPEDIVEPGVLPSERLEREVLGEWDVAA